MLTIFFLLALVLLLTVPSAFAQNTTNSSQHTDKKSNHYKFCIKLTDKKTRSIICPDIYSGSETNFVPGG